MTSTPVSWWLLQLFHCLREDIEVSRWTFPSDRKLCYDDLLSEMLDSEPSLLC